LYEAVIRPVEGFIAGARQLVIVPDARLAGTPFSALYDATAQRYLIERVPVALAASAGTLRSAGRDTGSRSVAAIALPAGRESNTVALPAAQRELADVAATYGTASVIPPTNATLAALRHAQATADVIHLAGHTTRQPGTSEQVLVFAAGAARGTERVSWKTILASPFRRTNVVVLAACETLRSPSPVHAGAMSLGAAFVAAGASDVIGTLAPIPDRDALSLFIAVHRGLAAGDNPAGALRQAQLEAIRHEKETNGAQAWRAVALMTGRISPPPQTVRP
jgi:CHAT domain-containing protein